MTQLRHRRVPARRQRGVLLLSFVLVILTAASYIFLSKLNGETGAPGYNIARTHSALVEAKMALIGYAVSYPDKINGDFGPGYLPCPADGRDGVSRSACASATNSMTGRFPWATLDSNDIRDASGEQLWYALSENYRYNPHLLPLNSDTPGQIGVDAMTDVVAVLIAAGPALTGQDTRAAAPNSPANYLEDDNATTGDDAFTRIGAGEFNDQLLLVTRGELMAAVERRVLGEVARAMNAYFAANGNGYPWLSPFADPTTANFKGIAGIMEGQLPFHYAGDPNPGPNEVTFDTAMTVSWANLNGADETELQDDDGANEIPGECLTDSDCADLGAGGDPDFGPIALNVLVTDGSCVWWDPDVDNGPQARDYSRCTGSASMTVPLDFDGPPVVPGTLTRTYDVVLTFLDPDGAVLTDPSAVGGRLRDLDTTAPQDADPGDDTHEIEITITQVHRDDGALYPPRTEIMRVTADDNTSGNVSITGVQYDLDANAGELPGWFIESDWHHHVYVAYSNADAPGNASTCDVTAPCLTLRVQRAGMPATVDQTNVRGLVIAAGPNLVARDATMASWFEGENDQDTTPGVVYGLVPGSAVFNDQIRLLGTAP